MVERIGRSGEERRWGERGKRDFLKAPFGIKKNEGLKE